uniref:Uncharacterized protein n=1 Tax=uncultured alpha proteobacterium HF0130_20P23 TaxID=710809 RepID=E0XTC0_9PROT|nr:hypothetical protein [uncultured alpha proteobacterium HF0130_20P23]
MAPPARCKAKTEYIFGIRCFFSLNTYTSNNNLRYHTAVRNSSDIREYILTFITFFDHFSTLNYVGGIITTVFVDSLKSKQT